MNDRLKKGVVEILRRAQADIQLVMNNKNINASGRTSKSLKVFTYDKGARLVGGDKDTAPIPTLEIGRPGGAVPKGFCSIIKQWSKDKGLSFSTESERNTFAYFVAKKIAKEGTQRNKKNVDVYSTITQSVADQIRELLKEVVVGDIHLQVIKSNFNNRK